MPDYFAKLLHEVYIPRIQRGNASFAAKVLGARGALLSVLVHFFEQGRWGSPVQVGVKAQSLTAEDQLFVLMQAGLYLIHARGLGAPEARICYKRAEPLCHSLNRPLLLYSGLMGQWIIFPRHRKAKRDNADCETCLLAGAAAERRGAHGGGLPRSGSHGALSGRFRGGATIRDPWSPDLALGRRTVSGRRDLRAPSHLSAR
jgi:hypothetical protein